jgi:hypothetical protein
MRINLKTPFAEKDAVKALGARWDATQKLWYIVDVTDLTPFLRWIPTGDAAKVATPAPLITPSHNDVPHCGCDVLPWENCAHTTQP